VQQVCRIVVFHFQSTLCSVLSRLNRSFILCSSQQANLSGGTKMTRAERKQMMIKRLTHIQNLAKQKKFSEIENLINNNYV
jgi:hypothetical protein